MRPALIAVVVLGAALSPAGAETAPQDRYTLQPADGGFMRLDRETGQTSFCKPSADGYACQPTTESKNTTAGPAEAARLDSLERRMAALEEKLNMQPPSGLPPVPPLPEDDKKGGETKSGDQSLGLPSDQQMDRIAGFLEKALRKLKGLAVEPPKEDESGRERL